MRKPPRPQGEGVITPRMWFGIVVHWHRDGGRHAAGAGCQLAGRFHRRLGQHALRADHGVHDAGIIFTFHCLQRTVRRTERVRRIVLQQWLWGAVLLSLLLQMAVVYIPFLQQAFSTVSLSFEDWLLCTLVASSVLWLRELSKLMLRIARRNKWT